MIDSVGMKIISLNTWGGHVYEPLIEFVKTQSQDTDIFCFQEMVSSVNAKRNTSEKGWRLNLMQEMSEILPEFEVYFDPIQDNYETDTEIDGESQIGVAIMYRKSLNVIEKGSFFIYRHANAYDQKSWSTLGHNAVYLTIEQNRREIIVLSLHGTSQPGDKQDTPDRIKQSQKIIDFLEGKSASKIVMGDFNLFPNTESIKMIERSGFKNLITDFKIETTRGSLIKKLRPDFGTGEYGFQEFADFTFVTPDIKVTNFTVPDEPISDHLPMILEIEV